MVKGTSARLEEEMWKVEGEKRAHFLFIPYSLFPVLPSGLKGVRE
jgi:hypothetical protein